MRPSWVATLAAEPQGRQCKSLLTHRRFLVVTDRVAGVVKNFDLALQLQSSFVPIDGVFSAQAMPTVLAYESAYSLIHVGGHCERCLLG